MILRKLLLSSVLAAALVPWWATAVKAKTYDVLQLPAVESEKAAETLIYAIRKFGNRHFATGIFGHILYSDDGGQNWTQAKVPVRSGITDIHFPTAELGWAVGHEGVILHSSDGGKTWVKQYDGLRYGQEGLAYYEKMSAEDPNNPLYPFLVDEMHFAIEQGADKPLFKVHFHSENWGHALGAYGMLLVTRDGGKHWEHQLHTTENDSFYHVFDFATLPEQGKFLLAGEAGLFMIGDVVSKEAVLVENVPWEGSFFTAVDAADDSIVVGGLRGRMFHTADIGETWDIVDKPPTSSIVDSTRMKDGRLVAVGIAGEVLLSIDDGKSFTMVPVKSGGRIYTVAEGPGNSLLIGGPSGIKKLDLPQ